MSENPQTFVVQQTKPTLSGTRYRDEVYGDPVPLSYADAQVQAILPFYNKGKELSPYVPLAGLQLLSISTHRDHFPVTSMSHLGIQGYTSGHRTTAGALGFTVLGEEPFAPVLRTYAQWRNYHQPMYWTGPDELPPFDLSITFVTSLGDESFVLLRSVKITDTSRNLSTRDIQLSHVYSFQASRCTILMSDTYTRLNQGNAQPSPGKLLPQASNGSWNETSAPPYTHTTASTSTVSTVSTSTTTTSTTTTSSATTTTGTTTITATTASEPE